MIGVTKRIGEKINPKWMRNTTLTEKFLRGLTCPPVFADVISFNALPIFFKGDWGRTKYGIKLPTPEEIVERAFCLNLWDGWNFPRSQVLEALIC